jgi:hypothetical protein
MSSTGIGKSGGKPNDILNRNSFMNPIEHYREEKKKLNQVRKSSAIERQMQLDIVGAYLKGQEAGDIKREEILKHYYEKYKDFLDNQLIDPMNTKERYNLLMELIYKHEILHEEAENMGVKKAA